MQRLAACSVVIGFTLLPACYLIDADPDSGGGGGDCSEGRHRADPDGRGERCIRDESTCDRAEDCGTTDDACCFTACDEVAPDTFECTSGCAEAECIPDGDGCPEGFRCDGSGGCPACVPAEECPAGRVAMLDPAGSGAVVCVDPASECTSAADCPEPDCSCWYECVDRGAGLYGCAAACEEDAMEAPECNVDRDCVDLYGPGYGCQVGECGGGWCQPVTECVDDDDCVIVYDQGECCTCPESVPWTAVADDPCLVPLDGSADRPAPPDDDGDGEAADPPACPEIICLDEECPAIGCSEAGVAACRGGVCVSDKG